MRAADELKTFGRLARDGPAGEHPRQGAHIVLCVAAVHAQGVQLEQFAGVVFIEAAVVARALRVHALPLVQVKQHGRVLRTGQHQVFKLAQRMGARHMQRVVAAKGAHRALVLVDVEVVEPKLGHARQQRVFQAVVAATGQAPGDRFVHHGAVEVQGLGGLRKIKALVVGQGLVDRAGSGYSGAGLALFFGAFKELGQSQIDLGQSGRQGRRLLAGGPGGLELGVGPLARIRRALDRLQKRGAGAVAQAVEGTPACGHAAGVKAGRCGCFAGLAARSWAGRVGAGAQHQQ